VIFAIFPGSGADLQQQSAEKDDNKMIIIPNNRGQFMKRLLLASVSVLALIATSPARAADLPTTMPRKAPPIAPAPPFSWTGCYIGGNVGYGWGRKSIENAPDGFMIAYDEPGASLPVDTEGFLGGGQVGCNYQFAPTWVVGIEGDISAADITGSATDSVTTAVYNVKTDWIASVTGRVGYAWDRWLAYAKGGAAWADDKYTSSYGGGTWDASETRSGWTVGAGLEWAFADKWSARLEYDYYDFGTRNVTFTEPPSGSSIESVKQQIQTVKFGINYRFGP
jgi:outer membrane immunogenic protein